MGGCGGARMDKVDKDVKRLREEISEIRRGQASQRVQFDGFRNRLGLLQDKLESERLAAVRRRDRAHAPPLPDPFVNRLPRERVQAPMLSRVVVPPPAPPEPPKTITIGPDGVPEVSSPEPIKSKAPAASKRVAARKKTSKATRGKRSKKVVKSRAVPAGPRRGKRPPHEGQTDEERAAGEYRAAKEALDAGRMKVARSGFARFMKDHPSHALADNALYWTGETWYAQAMWLKAARAFGDVVGRYPGGNKVPDAMFKTGLCYSKVGETKLAVEVFENLRTLYPGTSAARLAGTQLQRLGAQP